MVVGDPVDRAADWRLRRQFDVELRVNLIRIAAVGAFYLIHLLHYHAAGGRAAWLDWFGLSAGGNLTPLLHTAVTCLALGWIAMAVVVHQLLAIGRLPWWLSYVSTGVDVLLLTAALVLSSGAGNTLCAAYFLLIIMAGLRLDLRLVQAATFASLLGYLALLGCARWPVGLAKLNPPAVLPRYQQLMFLLALALAGVLVGQGVRSVRRLCDVSAVQPDGNDPHERT